MFSGRTRRSEVVPGSADPARRLIYAVVVCAVRDLLKPDTLPLHRTTARTFITENKDLLYSAGIPPQKVQLLLEHTVRMR